MKKSKTAPRVLIGGTGSDCGKTTVVCGLLRALKNEYENVSAFKCGPDYIDPMFHSKILGAKSRNLDLYLCGEEAVKYLLAKSGPEDGISVIEGVMGIYDGFGFDNDEYSANHIARVTGTPEILIVNVRGKSASLLAEISGYLSYYKNNIRGVILNRCSKGMYPVYKKSIEDNLNIKVYGYMPQVEGASIESRHLGLVTADEITNIKEKIEMLGQAAAEGLDVEGIIELAKEAEVIKYQDMAGSDITDGKPVKIGIAMDKAFCFYYQDNLDYLKELGAELVYFSPMEDREIPEGLSGLVFGGGYPEVYGKILEDNESMRQSVLKACQYGMPVYGECGGFMYLGNSIETEDGTYRMVGALKGNCQMTKGLVRFGYKNLTANVDNIIAKEGQSIRCHEFHYSDSDVVGNTFTAVNRRGKDFLAVDREENTLAGYPHLHFFGNLDFAENLVRSCMEFRDKGGSRR